MTGSGSGTVRFAVGANPGSARQGALVVAGHTVAVSQDASACAATVTPSEATLQAGASDFAVDVTFAGGGNCPWTASASSSFISVKEGASGSGTGRVVFAIAANGSEARVGTATVAGRTVTLLQEGSQPPAVPCEFTVSPARLDVPASGLGPTVITVTKTQGATCLWVLRNSVDWVTITGSQSGEGSATFTITVAPNPNSTGRGTQVDLSANPNGPGVRISQAGTGPSPQCSFSLSPSQLTVPAAGGTFTINVTQASGPPCAWSAEQINSPFVTFTGATSGTGSGSFTINVAPNTLVARGGVVVVNGVGGPALIINQPGTSTGCTYTLGSTQLNLTAAGIPAPSFTTIRLMGQGNCVWTATASASWLSFDPMSGTMPPSGFWDLPLTVAANTGGARTGTITIGNATLTINQAAQQAATAVARLRFDSDPGDYIGRGTSVDQIYTAGQFEVLVQPLPFGLQFSARTGSHWALALAGPSGSLAPGLYENVARTSFQAPGQPGLAFYGDGRGCNTVTGRFLISEIVFGPSGVTRLHARFEQHCNNDSAKLRGEIWIDEQGSTNPPPLPPFPSLPTTPTTFLTIQSQPGDPIGSGQTATYTLAQAVFSTLNFNNQAVQINVQPSSGPFSWSIKLGAAAGQTLALGTYNNASLSPTRPPGIPEMLIRSGNGVGCNTNQGTFTVLELLVAPSGEVQRFRATFEQFCNGATAPLRGEIYVVANPWR